MIRGNETMTVFDLLVYSKHVYDVDFIDTEGTILDKMGIAKAIASKYSNMSVIEYTPSLLSNVSIKIIICV